MSLPTRYWPTPGTDAALAAAAAVVAAWLGAGAAEWLGAAGRLGAVPPGAAEAVVVAAGAPACAGLPPVPPLPPTEPTVGRTRWPAAAGPRGPATARFCPESDAAGRLISETDFQQRTVRYGLDAAGQVAAVTDPLGQSVAYRYDLLGNVTSKTVAEHVTSYAYDPAGRLVRAASPDAEVSRAYDAAGNLLSETVNGRTLDYGYDALGRRTRRTTPSGHATTWAYEPGGRPRALTTPGGTVDFTYDGLGRETERLLGGHLVLSAVWDAQHRLTNRRLHAGREGSSLLDRAYSYREDGGLVGIDDPYTGTRSIDLDPAGRVTAVRGTAQRETYAYDSAGNLTHADWPGTAATRDTMGTRRYSGSQLAGAGGARYEYDAAGRMTLRQVTRPSRRPDT